MIVAMSNSQTTFTLSELLADVADVSVSDDVSVSGIKIDSRDIATGDLFIALPGTKQHGNT